MMNESLNESIETLKSHMERAKQEAQSLLENKNVKFFIKAFFSSFPYDIYHHKKDNMLYCLIAFA
jgi:hypothetical protein